jgi:DNA-binding transcriptional MocR family regulator
MTNWLPDIANVPGPRYLAIAERMGMDIQAGRLRAGDRLPTHRDLAWKLGVTVGTVTRAYAEAERRGLLVGEVGRGSFVREGNPEAASPRRRRRATTGSSISRATSRPITARAR